MHIALQIGINNLRGRLAAQVVVLGYNLANLWIKADPQLLLSLRIPFAGQMYKVEEICQVGKEDEEHFHLYVKPVEATANVVEVLVQKNPDVKTEVVKEEQVYEGQPTHVLMTFPPIDKKRHDVLHELIKARYEEIKFNMDETFGEAEADLVKVAQKLNNPQDIEAAREEYRKLHESYLEQLKNVRNEYDEYISAQCQHHLEMEESLMSKNENEVMKKVQL